MLSSWSVFVSGSQRVTGRRWEISSGKDGQLAEELPHLVDRKQGLRRRAAAPVYEEASLAAQVEVGVNLVLAAPRRAGDLHDGVVIVPEVGPQLFAGAVKKLLHAAGVGVEKAEGRGNMVRTMAEGVVGQQVRGADCAHGISFSVHDVA